MTVYALNDSSGNGRHGTYGLAGDISGIQFGLPTSDFGGANFTAGDAEVAVAGTQQVGDVPLAAALFAADFTLFGQFAHLANDTELFRAYDASGPVVQVFGNPGGVFALKCVRWYDLTHNDTAINTVGGTMGFGPHFWAVTYDSTTGTFQFYEDFANLASPAAFGVHAQTRTPTDGILGIANSPASPAFTRFDEVAMFPAVLSAADLITIWTARATFAGWNAAVLAKTPSGFYHLDEPSGWTIGSLGFA